MQVIGATQMTLTEHIERLLHTLVIIERWRLLAIVPLWFVSTICAGYVGYAWATWKAKRRRNNDNNASGNESVVTQSLGTNSNLLQQQMNQVTQQNALTTQMVITHLLNR